MNVVAVFLLALGGVLPAQMRAPASAKAGGSVVVEVASNANSIAVVVAGRLWSLPVGPDRRVVVPVPEQPGEVLLVVVGSGAAAYALRIAIAPP